MDGWNGGNYTGDLESVQKYFGKCAELSAPNSEYRKRFRFYAGKENAKKAMKKAKEYYSKVEKSEEKE